MIIQKVAITFYPHEHRAAWKPELYAISEAHYEALLGAAKKQFKKQGLEAVKVIFSPNEYLEWLEDRADDESMRAAWAAMKLREMKK